MKPVFFKQPERLLLALIFPFLFLQLINATAIKSKQSGSWTAVSTWEGGLVPTDNDDVIIKIGHTVTRSTAFVSHGYLYVYGTMVYTGNVSREFYVGTDIEIDGVLRVEGGSLFAGGAVYGDGLFKQTAGSTTFFKAVVQQYTDILGGSVYYQNINNGNLYLDNLSLKNATLEVDGTENLIIKKTMTWSTGGKLKPSSEIKIEADAVLTFDNGGTRYNDATIYNYGTIYSGTGNLTALAGAGVIYNYGDWEATVPSGTMTVSKQTLYNSNNSSFLKKGAGSIVFDASSHFSMDYNTAAFHLQQGNFTMKPNGFSYLGGTWQVDAGCVLNFTDDGSGKYPLFFGPVFKNNGQVKGATLRFVSDYITTLEGSGQFQKMEIAKTGGEVTLAGSPEITQELKLTSERIVLNQYDLRLGTAAITKGSDYNSYIQTNGTGSCVRVCPPNVFTNFPVGNAMYAPFIVKLNAGSTQDFFRVRVTDNFYGEYAGNNPSCSSEIPVGVVGHNWYVSEQTAGGSDADVWADWQVNAERNGFDRTNCTLGRYVNGDWKDSGFSPAVVIGSIIEAYSAKLSSFGLFGVFDEGHEQDVNFITPAPTANAPICEWDDLQLHANTSPNAEIQWNGPNGYQSNLPDPIIPGIQLSQDGSYVVIASQYGCPAQQASITVQVNAEPTPTVLGPDHIQPGESATLTAYGGTSYLWSTGDSVQSITVTPTQITDYVVTVSNASGCTATVLHTVQVSGASATHEAEGGIGQVKMVPNPAFDASSLVFDSANPGEGQLTITDARGAQLFHQNVVITSGHNQLNLSLANFPAGAYQLILIKENEVKTIRIVKLRGE